MDVDVDSILWSCVKLAPPDAVEPVLLHDLHPRQEAIDGVRQVYVAILGTLALT